MQVISPDPLVGLAGLPLPDSVVVRVLDRNGRGMSGILVRFDPQTGGGTITPADVRTGTDGYARAIWRLGGAGDQMGLARVEGLAPVQLNARTISISPTAVAMLGTMGEFLDSFRSGLQEAIRTNPQLAPYVEAKLALLRTPGIGGEILAGRRYVEDTLHSRSGAALTITAAFPAEPMRGEALQSVRAIQAGVPVLEDLIGEPFPASTVRLWYGFTIGAGGGGGLLFLEDRTTYEARTPETRFPFEAGILHELGHSYVGSEPLAQFLEVYGFNRMASGSADLRTWRYTRGYLPGSEANRGVHALLDVYALIGPEAMGRAYRAVLPLRPRYGEPLSAAARQLFVDAAPPELRAEVATRMLRVGN
jgi:hypothetical protein